MRWLLLLAVVLLLNACSDDPTPEGQRVKVEALSCSTGFEEVGNSSARTTRAWNPSPYVTYDVIYGTNGMFADQKDLVNKSIYTFFTNDEKDNQEGILYYRETDTKWYLNTEIESSGSSPYQVYGYIPKEDAEGATIASLEGSYSTGAVLTINGLSTVTPSDICVIIGAKDGIADNNSYNEDEDHPYTVTGFAPGKFDVSFVGGDNATNYIFLLFDHLYSSMRFSFTVDANYNKLRTIRLRKLELIAYADDHGGGVKAKYNATITLRKNESGTSPVESVRFTPDNSSAYVAPTKLYSGELTLSTSSSDFLGCFVPGVNTYFKLRSTYDVYDKNVTETHPEGNLIRQGCQAENTIDLRDKFGSYMDYDNNTGIYRTRRGYCYTYNIKVQPTYLYMLSEPDVDNPTITIGS